MSLVCLGARPLHPYRTTSGVTGILSQSAHRGDCNQCHSAHGETGITYEHALLGPDDNTLCERCHSTAWGGGSYAGLWLYNDSSHGSGSGTVWPGPSPPPRTETGAAGKCLNCHDPHGWEDATGVIPGLMIGREESLCLTCHDGSPASTDIDRDARKTYRHPMSRYAGRHTGPLESDPAAFAAAPQDNRHAECPDCHNPHVVSHEPGGTPPAADLSRTTLGVSRLLVANSGAGTAPAYRFAAGSDTVSTPRAEYQLCFKCHSSWTTQPTGQTDLALALNPANASYHPVEGPGADRTIDPGAFTLGWSATSLTRCGDCHGSDFPGAAAGPHGSSYRYILRQPYTASSAPRIMASDELCFRCHAYDVYGNPGSGDPVRVLSRFNKPGAAMGHAEHVGAQQVPCYACHVTHGAASQRHLLVVGRLPGILSYTETMSGGSCEATCHVARSYTTNYAR